MSQVQWAGPALRDLETIDDYWALHAPARAASIIAAIDFAASFLADTPRAGMPIDDRGVRKWRVRGTDYLLIHRLSERANVQILRVFHDRQNWLDQ